MNVYFVFCEDFRVYGMQAINISRNCKYTVILNLFSNDDKVFKKRLRFKLGHYVIPLSIPLCYKNLITKQNDKKWYYSQPNSTIEI